MKPEDFALFSLLLKQRSGLVLTAEKAYLLESRLLPVTRKYTLKSLEDMAEALRSKRDEALMFDITEAMTTHETHFFRDKKPFALFRETLLPRLLTSRAASKTIRIWSAATSSGQEAYSLAMVCANEAEKLEGWSVEIVGTDLSREMVRRAKSGIYTQLEMQRGLPIGYLVKYFQQLAGEKWQIKDSIRQMVQFGEGNLLSDMGAVGPFDVVFCRNVLSYFDPATKTQVLELISGLMSSDSFLVLGGTESTENLSDKFKLLPGISPLHVKTAALRDPMPQVVNA